ncbi:hypothetical protein [Streptomyces sp. NPDC059788]|uniref:MmyB family transcriptional regulator n=1 Tax=Streptomyces sp. NPDC059788 TaxID=3346948 RepID=UPI00366040E4
MPVTADGRRRLRPRSLARRFSALGATRRADLGLPASGDAYSPRLLAGHPALAMDERFDIRLADAAYRRLWSDPDSLPRERRNLLLQLASGPDGT